MSSTANQRGEKTPGETRTFFVDFGASTVSPTGKLNLGDTLTGTPTIVQDSVDPSTGSSLTLASKAVNSSSVIINGRTCIAGEAVSVSVAGGTDACAYRLKITCATVAGETVIGYFYIDVVDR